MALFDEGHTTTRDERLARLQGFLCAFEEINLRSDHIYTFTIDRLERRATLEETLGAYVGGIKTVALQPIDSWRDDLIPVVERWLFAFQIDTTTGAAEQTRPGSSALRDPRRRAELAAALLEEVAQTIAPVQVWSVQFEVDGFYECEWNDTAFEAEDAIYVLHLGVSD